ncbi:MAG: WD40 repeat domain-containing protein [Gemmatimonadetes bacterium]|nr:WD40 repeat domain-containing protein [Gemmatimonadota bacterium]
MSDPQPTASPVADTSSSIPPSAPDVTAAAAGSLAATPPAAPRHINTVDEAGGRDGAWLSATHFAVASPAGVGLYDLSLAEPRRAPLGTSGDVTALAFVPGRRSLVLGDGDGQVHSNELSSGRAGFHVGLNRGAILHLATDGRHVSAASEVDVVVTDLDTRSEWHLPDQRRAVAWMGDGVFATLGRSGVEVWLCETRGRVASMPVDVGQVVALEYLAAPGMLAAGLHGGAVVVWSMMDDPPSARGEIRVPGGLAALAVAPDGKTLASGSPDGTVRLWNDFAADAPPAADAGAPIVALRFSADGSRLAAVTARGISLFALAD